MTVRHTVDSITSDALDQLYAELDRLTAELGDYEQRAENFEGRATAFERRAQDRADRIERLTTDRDQLRTRLAEQEAETMRQHERAQRAEAAIARVRKLIADDPSGIFSDDEIRAALGEQSAPAPAATQATEPREHCGHLMPAWVAGPRSECTLRPGHQGSHADDRGARWWYDPT